MFSLNFGQEEEWLCSLFSFFFQVLLFLLIYIEIHLSTSRLGSSPAREQKFLCLWDHSDLNNFFSEVFQTEVPLIFSKSKSFASIEGLLGLFGTVRFIG